jgi:hypothetical protein
MMLMVMKLGAAGYPGSDNFEDIAKELKMPFAVVDFHLPFPAVYGEQYGPPKMTIRHYYVTDGQGHKSPHYDIIAVTSLLGCLIDGSTHGRLRPTFHKHRDFNVYLYIRSCLPLALAEPQFCPSHAIFYMDPCVLYGVYTRLY